MPTTRLVPFVQATTNREKVLAYLNQHQSITPLRAISEFGETRLAARIHELRNEGYEIECEMLQAMNGKRYAEYYLA